MGPKLLIQTHFANHHATVDAFYRKMKPEIAAGESERYIGGGKSQLEYLGLKVPQINTLFNAQLDIHALPDHEQTEVWNFIWHKSHCYEVKTAALTFFTAPKRIKVAINFWPLLKDWAERVDNWAHSDGLSKFYSQCLETHPQMVLPALKKWNASKYPWLQRQSMVSLLCYSSSRKTYLPFKTMIPFVKCHLKNQEIYVQKAVGWTLREIGNIYPSEVWQFLQENIFQLSAIAFSSSTEKLEPKKKALLKEIRRNNRG